MNIDEYMESQGTRSSPSEPKEPKVPRGLDKALVGVKALAGWNVNDEQQIVDEKTIVALINRLHTYSEDRKAHLKEKWLYNFAHIIGEHDVKYNSNMARVARQKQPKWRSSHVANYIGTIVQREAAYVTQRPLSPEIIAKSSEDRDVKKSHMAERVLEATIEEKCVSLVIMQCFIWCQVTGIAFMKIWWDKTRGTRSTHNESTIDENGEVSERIVTEVYEGDIRYDVLSPLNLHVDPETANIEDARWALHVEHKTKSWAVEKYGPEILEKIGASPNGSQAISIFSSFWQMLKDFTSRSNEPEFVLVKEFWQRPDPLSKDEWRKSGCQIIVVNDHLVEVNKWPLKKFDKLPFVQFSDGWLPGLDEFGCTKTAQLIKPQSVYNQVWRRSLESIALMNSPKVMIPHMCNVNKKAFTSKAGEKVYYTPGPQGEQPHYLNPPRTHPQSSEVLMERTLKDIDNISAQHDVSRGVAPANASGVAIEILQEADNSIRGPGLHYHESSVEKVCRYTLEILKNFVESIRRLPWQNTSKYEILEFIGSDIDYFSVKIRPGSMKPVSKASNNEFILRLLETGVLGPYENDEHRKMMFGVIRSLDSGQLQAIKDEANKDRYRASAENEAMDRGELVIPSFVDNHEEHLKEHYDRMKDMSYDEQPDNVKNIYNQHVAFTKMMAISSGLEDQVMLEQLAKLQTSTGEQLLPTEIMNSLEEQLMKPELMMQQMQQGQQQMAQTDQQMAQTEQQMMAPQQPPVGPNKGSGV